MDAGRLDESLAVYYSHLNATLVALYAGTDQEQQLGRVVGQHLGKQRAYDEYVRLAAAAEAAAAASNGGCMFNEVPTDRRLLVECFQGVDLRYCASPASSSSFASSPPSSPACGPSL